jgi:hypothetical protein
MINRVGQAAEYQTYRILALPDLSRPAACSEVDCGSWRYGWETTVDERTDLGIAQAQYIRVRSGRTYRETKTAMGLTVFRFDSGQRCFAEHQTRPEIYSRAVGVQDMPAGPAYVHKSATDWQEDFGEHQERLADEARRG